MPPPVREPATEPTWRAVAAQLGRTPRGTRAVAHRCPCGLPDVVETTPRLADGTPFPTLFYLTCPRAVAGVQPAGVRRADEGDGRAAGRRSGPGRALPARARDYLARREAIGRVPEIEGVSAGGMPDRVKCLHVHLGHALAAGPGVNPFGDEVLAAAGAVVARRSLRGAGGLTRRCREPGRVRCRSVVVRRARTSDVRAASGSLIDTYCGGPAAAQQATVTLYEDVQEFWVAERRRRTVLGCGALHVMWEDLAEIRTVAVDPACRGHRIGQRIVTELLATRPASWASPGSSCSPSRPGSSAPSGSSQIDGAPVPPAVYEQLLRSYDEGVAEFLGLERVKPNTLGNARMLLRL